MMEKPAETMLERMIERIGLVPATMEADVRHVLSAAAVERVAKAALEAIRKADRTVVFAIFDLMDSGDLGEDYDTQDVWEAGIDAILSCEA